MSSSHSMMAMAAPGLTMAACALAAPPPFVPTPAPTRAAATPATAAAVPIAAAPPGTLRYILAETSEARYRVREQLAGFNLPSDAGGSTNSVKGSLTLDGGGLVDPATSKVTVDLRTLKSDDRGRDGFIQRATIETSRFPTAEFVVKDIKGLPLPVPSDGTAELELTGDLTIHGVTKPVVWKAAAQFLENQVKGQAKTAFSFGDFGMQQPVYQRVLSVEDNVRLELDFVFNKG